jgi:hypothetical protein
MDTNTATIASANHQEEAADDPERRKSLEQILDLVMGIEADEVRQRYPDLAPFCTGKWGPFSDGDWTYATDGQICVRVPRRPDVPDRKWPQPNAGPLFIGHGEMRMRPIDVSELPPENREECPYCRRGYITNHDDLSVEVNGAAFAARYISMLNNLPNVRISEALSEHTLSFLFDGGEGLIMSLRGITLGTIHKGETCESALKESKYRRNMNLLISLRDSGFLKEEDDGWTYCVADEVYDALRRLDQDEVDDDEAAA